MAMEVEQHKFMFRFYFCESCEKVCGKNKLKILTFFFPFTACANSHSVVSPTVDGLRLDISVQNNISANFNRDCHNLITKIKYFDFKTYCTYKNILDFITQLSTT